MDNVLIYEVIGTAILIIMGGGVAANSIMKKSNAEGAGWVNIAFGWGLSVFIAVIVAGDPPSLCSRDFAPLRLSLNLNLIFTTFAP